MYQNRVTLIGFLGKDAEVRTTANTQAHYTVLSLATKRRRGDRESGERLSQTTWHCCIVWGKLGEFAETLTKGAHLQIEGDIRTREYTQRIGKGKKPAEVKRTITEVRVASILKLDRPVRTSDQPADKSASEQGVPF